MDKNKGRRVREVVFTAAGFVILMAIIWYISGSVKKTPLLSEDGMEYVKGPVTEIIKGNKGNGSSSAAGMAGSQDVKVKITSGSYKGKIVEANNLNGYLYGANCQVGTRVILQVSAYEGNLTANVYNYDREYGLYALIGLFLIVLCLIGGRRGIYSAIALIFTFICIIGLYLPLLYKGASPFPVTVLTVCLITIVSLLLIGGYTRKTVCAAAGTIMGVAVSGCIAMVFGKITHISGYNTEDIENLVYVAQASDWRSFVCRNFDRIFRSGDGCGNVYIQYTAGDPGSEPWNQQKEVVPIRHPCRKRYDGYHVQHIDPCLYRQFLKHNDYDLCLCLSI